MRGSSMTEEHAKNRTDSMRDVRPNRAPSEINAKPRKRIGSESMHIGNTSVATRKVISFYGR